MEGKVKQRFFVAPKMAIMKNDLSNLLLSKDRVSMYDVLDEASILVARRLAQYRVVISDFYFMALRCGDREIVEQIWNEAHKKKDIPLIALLFTIEQRFRRDRFTSV